MNKKIENLYLEPSQPGSFSGLETFFHALKNLKKKVDKEELRDWLKSQKGYTLHYPNIAKFPRNRIIVTGIDTLWQADLADFQNISKYNDDYNYLLICIDVFSKFLMVEKSKNKNANTTLEGFMRILEKSNRKPKQLQTDDGKEFVNTIFQKYLAKNNINYYTISSDKKACIAERVIRTLKEKIYRYFTQENTQNYISVLDQFVDSYNNTYHRTIKMTPNDVTLKNQESVFEKTYLYGDVKPLNLKFEIGEKVRLTNMKRVFKKGYLKKWTIEIFEISKSLRIPRSPPVYKIKDMENQEIIGVFYDQELQKVF